MSKLKSILILIISTFIFIQCQAGTNKRENKSTGILSDTVKSDKSQKMKVEHLLIGKWFTPHAADINITFSKDRTFIFNNFNIKTQEIEVLRGKFELDGNNLILNYDNKRQQIFKFEKGKGVDDNYYITKGKKYYFVKSDL